MSEQVLMKRIQMVLSNAGMKCFRTNVGMGWTGSRVRQNPDGSVTIYDPRPFSTGLPRGFPDLLSLCPEGRTALLEVKTAKGELSKDQRHFAEVMQPLGHVVSVVRSEEEALDACLQSMRSSR
ncbi:VRR-NUC domain-containing protein [Eubacteriales bacterium OttesenSCG-928-A19]|nr:VRR-NUC domain-containing protein [Eubacteriales bacterium OttesenSCG-928-A19]